MSEEISTEESFWLEKIEKLLTKDKLYGVLWFGHFIYASLVLVKPHDENDKKIGSIWKAIYESYYDLVPVDDKELGRVVVTETSRSITLKELHEALDGLVSKMYVEDDVFLHISKS